jgi:hypothetical protein
MGLGLERTASWTSPGAAAEPGCPWAKYGVGHALVRPYGSVYSSLYTNQGDSIVEEILRRRSSSPSPAAGEPPNPPPDAAPARVNAAPPAGGTPPPPPVFSTSPTPSSKVAGGH